MGAFVKEHLLQISLDTRAYLYKLGGSYTAHIFTIYLYIVDTCRRHSDHRRYHSSRWFTQKNHCRYSNGDNYTQQYSQSYNTLIARQFGK